MLPGPMAAESPQIRIFPEPSAEEREALLTALAGLGEGEQPPPAYRSAWRLAGLPADAEDDG